MFNSLWDFRSFISLKVLAGPPAQLWIISFFITIDFFDNTKEDSDIIAQKGESH